MICVGVACVDTHDRLVTADTLEQLDLQPQAEEVLKAVLERAEHLEEQASGMTVLDE